MHGFMNRKKRLLIFILISVIFSCCNEQNTEFFKKKKTKRPCTQKLHIVNKPSKTIRTRFNCPKGFERVAVKSNSFGEYLRNSELKPFASYVFYYNGEPKKKENVYISVIKMDIGNRDLQQCADAVMRLRGEYLYKQKRFKEIHFNFVSDNKPRYFKNYAKGDYSYSKFRKYMNYIFSFANTSSLQDELEPVKDIDFMKIGDVFIQKGRPYGHAVIVVDMALNKKNRNKIFILAQSYMPAQEIQILVNQQENQISPWYKLRNSAIYTPEWTFNPKDLNRFKNK
jgi:hypothetical protein